MFFDYTDNISYRGVDFDNKVLGSQLLGFIYFSVKIGEYNYRDFGQFRFILDYFKNVITAQIAR